MNLYLSYDGNNRHNKHTYNESEMLRDNVMIKDTKVVAYPFCGVSTSNGEIANSFASRSILFKCSTCEKITLSARYAEIITKEEIEKLHPQHDYTNDVVFYSVKLYRIISISINSLCRFSMTKDITNDDVIAFYNDLEKFGNENKIDINYQIDCHFANKFLKDNELAKKYEIKYLGDYGKHLAVRIDSYSLSNIPFRGYTIVKYVENDDVVSTIVADFN